MPTINSSISTIKGAVDFSGVLTVGYFLQYQIDGNFRLVAVPSTNPGGANGALQYNANGVFAGSSNVVWDTVNNVLNINGDFQFGNRTTVFKVGLADPSIVIYGQGGGNRLVQIDGGASQGTLFFCTVNGNEDVFRVEPGGNSLFKTRSSVNVPLTIKGASGQSANLQEWRDSSDSVLAFVDSTGSIQTKSQKVISALTNSTTIFQVTGGDSQNFIEIHGDGDANFRNRFGASWLHFEAASGAVRVGDVIANSMQASFNCYAAYYGDGNSRFLDCNITGTAFRVRWLTTTEVGLTIKAPVGQIANLQEWQDSSGNPLALIDSAGKIQSGSATRIWTNGGESRIEATGSNQLTLHGNLSSVPVVIAPAYGVSGTFRFGAPSAGYVNIVLVTSGGSTVGEVGIDSVNQFYLKPGSGSGLRVLSNSIGTPTIIVKGINGQTANLQEWQDNSGTIQSRITSAGLLEINQGNVNNAQAISILNAGLGTAGARLQLASGGQFELSTSGSRFLLLTSNRSMWFRVDNNGYDPSPEAFLFENNIPVTRTVVVVKGCSGQTANLQEWQDNNAVAQFAVGSTGQIKTNQVAAATTLGSVTNKLPIYNAAGTLIGYIPVYNSIT